MNKTLRNLLLSALVGAITVGAGLGIIAILILVPLASKIAVASVASAMVIGGRIHYLLRERLD